MPKVKKINIDMARYTALAVALPTLSVKERQEFYEMGRTLANQDTEIKAIGAAREGIISAAREQVNGAVSEAWDEVLRKAANVPYREDCYRALLTVAADGSERGTTEICSRVLNGKVKLSLVATRVQGPTVDGNTSYLLKGTADSIPPNVREAFGAQSEGDENEGEGEGEPDTADTGS